MTLIGVVDLGGRILIGGDGRATMDAGNRTMVSVPADKVFRAAKMPQVLWGFSGEVGIAQSFTRWIDAQSFDTWDALCDGAIPALAQFNGNRRAIATLGRVDCEPIEVLVCGYIGTEARTVVLDSNGSWWTPKPEETPVFIGSAIAHAMIAWDALARRLSAKDLRTEKAFRDVLEVTADRLETLHLPVNILQAVPEVTNP